MSYQRLESRDNSYQQKQPIQSIIVSAPDKALLITVAFLVIIGFMAIFSASAPKCIEEGGNPAQFLIKQIICFVVGFLGLKFFTNYDYKKLSDWNLIFAGSILLLLLLVDFTPLGVTVNGAKRWINILGFQLQPSEFAKPAVVLLLATVFKKDANLFDQQKWVTAFIPILIMLGFIFVQPNLSMVILLLSTSVVMFLAAGGSLKLFFSCLTLMLTTVIIAATTIIKPYQMQRIRTWKHPELDPQGAGYNIIQSLIAFASGGFSGVGYGGSIQKLSYLPECHTDFIFAIIAEELGWVGCVLVIGLFWTLIHRGFLIAARCPDMFGKLLAVGITFSIGFQAFLNISVASSFFPTTGVPLPFISYGGSSLIVSLCMIGILLNISKKRIKKIRNVENV
ncbi:TPA: putative lipid II flippase FtsW [Candidatus Scatousia excrementigallinarum]|uniref:Probable peptidoglycan glycosyltransferase FtsW n=1 Tax=Candidatus Scatousia excrementigallinarum TaxID=2840935 RepID=A0A9D1JP61_9BACT|nr:putative lipid II flippase FtsW [Candidatus Scatousia excrementigallinarum]